MHKIGRKTKFVFLGLHDQFVVNLDIREDELKRRLLAFLEEYHELEGYEGYEIGTAA